MAAARARGRGEPVEPGAPGRRALYFCGSIRGGREDRALYARIVSRLRRFGAVLTEHMAAAELGARGEAPGARAAGRQTWGQAGERRARPPPLTATARPTLLPGARSSAPALEGTRVGAGGVCPSTLW